MRRALLGLFLLPSLALGAAYNTGELHTHMIVKPLTMDRQAYRSLSFWLPLDTATGSKGGAFGDGLTTPTITNNANVGTYRDRSTGLLTPGTANSLRIEPEGGLFEQAGTNSVTVSQDAGSWGSSSSGVTVDTTTAPDGTLTADTLVKANTNTFDNRFQNLSLTAGVTYTMSAFVKQGTGTLPGIGTFVNSNSDFQVCVNSSGAVTTEFDNNGGSIISSGAQSAPNGFWRLSVTFAAKSTATHPFRLVTDGTASSTANNIFWGMQFETNKFATSYIPTTTATVTRNKDTFVINSLGNVAPGELTCSASAARETTAVVANTTFVQSSPSNVAGVLSIFASGSNSIRGGLQVYVSDPISATWDGGGSNLWPTSPIRVTNVLQKTINTGYKNGNFIASRAVTVALPASSGNMGLGEDSSGNGQQPYGWMKDVYYFRRALMRHEVNLLK